MKRVLIGGIGNVLLGDDGVGPYVVRHLESLYAFPDNVEIADLGTPALDLTHRIVGLEALILVDSVASDGLSSMTPGKIVLYRKADIIRETPAQRLDPHSPALSECLMAAEMLGASPEHVLLVGVLGKSYKPGRPLSEDVRQSVGKVMEAILDELERLGVDFQNRMTPNDPGIWWSESLPV